MTKLTAEGDPSKGFTFVVRDWDSGLLPPADMFHPTETRSTAVAGPIINGRFIGGNVVTTEGADHYVAEHGFVDQREPRGVTE